jgi:hypothetical protein
MGDEGKKFEGLFKAFGDYGKAIATEFLSNFDTTEIGKQIQSYEEKAVNVVKSFGTGRDKIVEMKASMADAVVSVTQLGGGLDDVAKIAKSVGENLNRNIILTKDSYKDLYATAQVTGVQYDTLIPKFKDAGFSVYQISENMKKVVDTATASGVNAQKVSSMVVSNMSLMDKYNFAGGVEGLAKMATQAVNLRISTDQIERVMSKAFEPDQAIEMAAALQRLGVAQSDLLDPLRLMDLAQNDPAELQNQIVEMSKSFVEFDEKSKSFQIAPGAKRQLQEVASAMGMSASELAKMAKGAAELEDKMNKIHFPGDMFTEEQKTMIANMAEMGPGGEYTLRMDGKDLKLDEAMIKMQSMDEESRNKFLADSKPKTMEEMAKQQLTLTERGTAAIEALANRFGAAQASTETQEMAMQAQLQITESIAKFMGGGEKLQVPAIRQTTENIEQGLIKGVQSGDILGSLGRAKDEGRKYLGEAFDDIIVSGADALKGLGESTNPLINIMTNLGSQALNAITSHEKLNGTFGTLNTTIDNTNKKLGGTKPIITASALPTNTENKDVKNTLENKTTPEASSSEVKFNPLEIKLTISGLLPGMSEEQIRQIIIEGKLNEVLYNAIKDAEKTKVK